MKRLAFKAAPLLAALALAGCASISPDGLRGDVAEHTEGRLPAGAQLPSPDAQALQDAQTQIADWLKTPVDADTAVRIALLNNPGLQAQLAQLGIADAQRVQVLTLPNPSFTFGRFRNGHEREIERQLGFGLVQLITLPWRSRWQAGRWTGHADGRPAGAAAGLGHTPRLAARRGRRASPGRQRTHA
jgi:outer membrane protein TolC